VCIRQEEGFCCVQFQVCADQSTPTAGINANPGFSLDETNAGVMYDSICNTFDYIAIPGGYI
jgi:hypothetical protein